MMNKKIISQNSIYNCITVHFTWLMFVISHVSGWQPNLCNKWQVLWTRTDDSREDDVAKWARLGGPCTLGLTRWRGVASFLAQRRSASAGLYYLELFRATSNYSLFFAGRIASEPSIRRVVLRMIYKPGCVRVALFLGQTDFCDDAGQVLCPRVGRSSLLLQSARMKYSTIPRHPT